MADYLSPTYPVSLTGAWQTVGPFAERVTLQPRGGAVLVSRNSAGEGDNGIKVFEDQPFDLPDGATVQARALVAGDVRLIVSAALG